MRWPFVFLLNFLYLHVFDQPAVGVDFETLNGIVTKIANDKHQLPKTFRIRQLELLVELLVGIYTLVELVAIFILDGQAEAGADGIVVLHIEEESTIVGADVFDLRGAFIFLTDRTMRAIGQAYQARTGKKKRENDRFHKNKFNDDKFVFDPAS